MPPAVNMLDAKLGWAGRIEPISIFPYMILSAIHPVCWGGGGVVSAAVGGSTLIGRCAVLAVFGKSHEAEINIT
jgi:hypothetical protein